MKLKYIVDKEMPIKEYLEYVGISRHLRKKVRNLDNLYVNGKKEKNYYILKINDCLELEFNEDINSEYDANFNDLDKLNILYEDEYYIIIDKPNDISSQPSLKHPTYNMLSILKAYFINNNINSNIHLVNRLDYATSGIMIISKSNIGVYELSKTKILKKYLCMTEGIFLEKEGLIDKKIKTNFQTDKVGEFVCDDTASMARSMMYAIEGMKACSASFGLSEKKVDSELLFMMKQFVDA